MRLYHSCCKVISTAVCSQASARVSKTFFSALKQLEKIPGVQKNPWCRKIPVQVEFTTLWCSENCCSGRKCVKSEKVSDTIGVNPDQG